MSLSHMTGAVPPQPLQPSAPATSAWVYIAPLGSVPRPTCMGTNGLVVRPSSPAVLGSRLFFRVPAYPSSYRGSRQYQVKKGGGVGKGRRALIICT